MPDPINHARSRALLIATAVSLDPMIPAMPTAAGSLAGMREVLTDDGLCGWPDTSVTSVPDASDAGELIGTLRRLASEAEETLLLYFAGPGILLSHDELYLGLAGRRPHDVEDSSLRYARVRRAMLKSRARLKVVILDCSYSGRVIPSLPATRVAEMTSINATYVLTASDREVDPGNATASAFTAELVATIRAGIPGGPPTLTLDDLYPPLVARLQQAGRPAPNRESTDLAGELPFTRNARYSPRPWPSDVSSSDAVSLRQPALSRRRAILMTSGIVVIGGIGGAIAAVESPSRASGMSSRKPSTLPEHATEVALAGSGDRITRIAFTFAGRYLIGGSGDTGIRPAVSLQLWDLTHPDRKAVPLEHGSTVHGVALHRDRTHFATAGDDGAVRLWDLTTRRSRLICMHEYTAWDVAFSPDGATLASSSSDPESVGKGQTVILSEVSSGITRAVLPHPASVSGLAFAPADAIPKGSQILVTGCNDHLVRVWDTSSARLRFPARPRELHGHKEAITQVVFRPHGKGMFATGSWDGTLRLWNLESTTPVATLGQGLFQGTVTGLAFSPDGQTLAAVCTNYLYIWDMRGLRPNPPMDSADTAGVAYNAAGTLLASTSRDIVLLWRT
jgi:WD40 repeat protein